MNDISYENIFKITNPEEFWHKIGNLKNRLNNYLYPNLYEFVTYVFTLPHSSASAERIFSKLTLMKNKLSNRLKVDTWTWKIGCLTMNL